MPYFGPDLGVEASSRSQVELRGKTAVRETECSHFHENYNKIPAPNNVWAAVCEVRPAGEDFRAMKGYEML